MKTNITMKENRMRYSFQVRYIPEKEKEEVTYKEVGALRPLLLRWLKREGFVFDYSTMHIYTDTDGYLVYEKTIWENFFVENPEKVFQEVRLDAATIAEALKELIKFYVDVRDIIHIVKGN